MPLKENSTGSIYSSPSLWIKIRWKNLVISHFF
jgi:hypothetical protein